MAEEEKQEGAEEKPKKPKLPIKLLINVAIGVAGLLIVVIVASMVAKAVKQPVIEFGPKPVEEKKKHRAPLATYLVRPEFIAKLADEEEMHLVKTGEFRLAYDLKNKLLATELEERRYEMADIINTVLITKTSKDLSSEEGKNKFKREVVDRINTLLESGQIEDVYVELIVQ